MAGWIDHWEPEDERSGRPTGKRIARKNLIFSIFAENLGFSVWVLWTIVVINLGNVGITLSLPEQFWLTAVPNLVGSTLRIPYTFAVPRFGGRLWTAISAVAAADPDAAAGDRRAERLARRRRATTRSSGCCSACAATAGFGGGNFSSSMANISFFYPERQEGLRARAQRRRRQPRRRRSTQLLVPLVIIVGVPAAAVKLPEHEVHLAYAGPDVDAVHRRRRASARGCTWTASRRRSPTRRSYVAALRARPDVDHVDPLHRHVRLVHRLLVRAAAGDQEHVPGVPRRATRSSPPTSPASASSAR